MSHRRGPCSVVVVSCVALAAAGCPHQAPSPVAAASSRAPVSTLTDASPSSATSAPPATAATVTTEGAQLGRGVLFGVARALNEGQIDLANEVGPRLQGKERRELSEALLAEHRLALTQVTTVQTRLGGVMPENSALRQAVVREVTDALVALARTDEAGLDSAYLDAQVALHRRAVEVLEELQPSATGAQLCALLESLRATFAGRLAALQTLREAQAGP